MAEPDTQVDEQQKAVAVGQAMGDARIETEGQPQAEQRAAVEQAGREKADEVGLPITDAQLKTMAGMIFGELSNLFEQRGAFDAPPEPVEPPPTAPPPPAGDTESAPSEAAAPRKASWAERHFGR
jgi:hypothetical protein